MWETLHQDSLFLGEVKADSAGWYSDIKMNGKVVSFKLDTGSAVTAIPTKLYKCKIDGPLPHTSKRLYGPNNKILPVVGQMQSKLESKDKNTTQSLFVIDNLARPLLCLPALTVLPLIERVDAVENQGEKEDPGEVFKKKFPKVFSGLGRLEGDYQIRLNEEAVPYALSTPRRIPLPLNDKVKDELERMEKMGVVSKIEKPTDLWFIY